MKHTLYTTLDSIKFDEHSLILTANSRLAINLQREFDAQHVNQQKALWKSAAILPFNSWVLQHWQEHNQQYYLLTPEQQLKLWEQVISENSGDLSLAAKSIASLAQQAFQSLTLWNIPLSMLEGHSDETSLFITWCEAFKKICSRKNWVSSEQLVTLFKQMVIHKNVALPDTIFITGFDELPPALDDLIHCLDEQTHLVLLKRVSECPSKNKVALYDQHDEINTMARWAKQLYMNNPLLKIGCIIPTLEQCRSKVSNTFTELFTIEKILPSLDNNELIFNISAGQKLIQFQLIQHALLVLKLCNNRLNLSETNILFQSPYLTENDHEANVGAEINAKCQEYYEDNLPLKVIYKIINSVNPEGSNWLERWQDLTRNIDQMPNKATPSEWINHFNALLTSIGWPGKRGLNSIEYQVLQRWKQLLTDFSHFNLVCGQMSLESALSLLADQVANTVFQPEGSDAPIQILGVLESAGVNFDALWVMGLSDEVWPPAAKPNPFIPYLIQQQYQLPHASAQREFNYTEQIMQRLMNCASTAYFSYPQFEGDKVLQPSQLLNTLNSVPSDKLHLDKSEPLARTINNNQCIHYIDDNTAPAITSSDAVFGGSEIPKLQALCPFRAFAELRLKARQKKEAKLELPENKKGSLLHQCLHHIWLELKDSYTLKQKSTAQLTDIIGHAITAVFKQDSHIFQSESQQYFLSCEKSRLNKLLFDWLQLEKERPDFSVTERETHHTVETNNLKIKLQVDRIDKTDDGYIIIDYKSGYQSIQSWFGDSITEPQLPLYCSFIKKNQFSGISYAQVRNQGMVFKGVVTEEANHTFSKLVSIDKARSNDAKKEWLQQIAHWRTTINSVCYDFSMGKADVNPINPTLTCRYCHLQSLCRIPLS